MKHVSLPHRGAVRRTAAIVGMAAIGLSACGSSPATVAEASSDAPEEIANKGTLTACVDPTVPPMEFFEEDDSKNPVGFDIDMINEVSDSWGVEPDVKVMEFSGLLPGLSGGTCDIVWSAIFILPERLEGEFDAVAYLNSGPMLLVPEGNPEGIEEPDDLSGMTVATQSGTNFPGMLDDLNDELEQAGESLVTYQEYPGANEAAQQVIVGRAQAFLGLDVDGYARINDEQFDWEIAYVYPKDLQYGIFYLKEDEELGAALEQAVDRLVQDGTMEEALEKWNLPTDGLVGQD